MIIIPVKLRYGSSEVKVNALLNTGFESDVPLISVPLDVADKLKLSFSKTKEFDTVGRFRGLALVSDTPVEVIVEKNSRRVSEKAFVIVVPGEEEVIMSYTLARKLKLAINLASEEWWIT